MIPLVRVAPLIILAFVRAAPALGQDGLPPGHPPIDAPDRLPPGHPPLDTPTAGIGDATDQLPPGHPSVDQMPPAPPPVAPEEIDSKKLLEKLDAMRGQLRERPKTAEIEYALGNLYYENGRYPDAIDYYRQLLERAAAPLQRYQAARAHPHEFVSPEQAGCPPSQKADFDQLIAVGDAKAAAAEYSAAVTCYEAALLPVVVAKARRANAFFLIGNPDRAVAEHHEVLAIEPDFLDSLFFLGAILFETGDGDVAKLRQAGEAWRKFLASNPDPEREKLVKENLIKLGRALANGGHVPLAPVQEAPMLRAGPGPIEPPPPAPELGPGQRRELKNAVASGQRLARKHDWNGSLAAFDRARRLDRADPEAATGAGIALLNLSKRAEAEAAFRDALGRDPKQGPALFELGEVFFEEEHFAGAARFWTQLLQQDPATADKYGVKARLAEAQAKRPQ